MEKYFLRNLIGEYMLELAEKDNRVVIVNADLMGTCRNRFFVEKYPERSYNVGIAEQNLVSFSAGLAHEGFIPYAFSMAPFISMRACEQCRTDVAYAGLNVRLITTYAGYSGGISGATHWGLEDCAIMNSIAGMTVLEPSDPVQAKQLMIQSVGYQGPLYLRSSVEPVVSTYGEKYECKIGKASITRQGDDGAFICSGVVVQFAIAAAQKIFETTGKKIRVVDIHTIKPIDKSAVIDAAQTGYVIAAQDHNVIGGLGQQVATVIAEAGISAKFKILGCIDQFIPMANASYLYHKYEYDTEGLVKKMTELLST